MKLSIVVRPVALALVSASLAMCQTARSDDSMAILPPSVDPPLGTHLGAQRTVGDGVAESADVDLAASVVAVKFLRDTGAVDNESLLTLLPDVEVAGINGNFTGIAGPATFTENTLNPATRVRGLGPADNARDDFLSDIPWDGFNVDGVRLQRGPSSLLFGTGSPAGVISTRTEDAAYRNAYSVENRVDKYGSNRNSINLNQVLIEDVLAIRFAALNDDELFEQQPAYNNTTRYFGALRFDPKLFDEHSTTTIRVKYEDGKVRSNNPRQDPPVDEITPWFKTGTDAYGNPGYDKLTLNEFSVANPNPSGTPLPGGPGGVLDNGTFALGGWAETRSYSPDNLNYYEATPGQSDGPPGGTPIKTIVSEPNVAHGLDNNSIGQLNFQPAGIPSEQQYAANVGTTIPNYINSGYAVFQYPGGPIPGGAYYADTVLTDPTLFNFYKYLLDGPNKREWQDWKAVKVAIDQSFFDHRLAFELDFDHQAYDAGSNQWLTGSNYAISVDVNQTYADGTPNPNVGRPYVGNAASNTNYAYATVRDTVRFTPTGEIRPEDFIANPRIARLIGRQDFGGLIERNQVTTNSYTWAEFATTPAYFEANQLNGTSAGNALASNDEFDWIAYLGPSLLNANSAHNANLNPVNFVIAPPTNQRTWNFNSSWNRPANVNDPGWVDPTAEYAYLNTKYGFTEYGTQADNPANYVGWQWEPITWMSASNPADFPSLVESANRTRFRDDSEGITYQGHLLDGDLMPTLGWREDRFTTYQTQAPTDPVNDFTSLSFPDNLGSRADVHGVTKSWGATYHLPAAWLGCLPSAPTVSLEFDGSENFKADPQRLDLAGQAPPNETGTTREVGVVVSAYAGRLTLKLDVFRTRVANATMDTTSGNSIAGLGNEAYYLADGLIWGYGWATAMQDGLKGLTPNSQYWDYSGEIGNGYYNGSPWYYDLYGGTSPNGVHYSGGLAVVNAWLHNPLPAQFFSSYNLYPQINPQFALATGNLRDGFSPVPPYSAEPVTGGGSTFGDHVLTENDLSHGVELELSAQPIRGWDIAIDCSHIRAIRESIDPMDQAFLSQLAGWMAGPAGEIRMWYNQGPPLMSVWGPSIVAPFTVILNQQGRDMPELSPWRVGATSTYTLQKGWLKGAFLGGDLQVEAGRILGYHYNPNFVNANATDPNYAAYASVTQGGLDPSQPFVGAVETHVGAWIGYTWRLPQKLAYRIQLNLSNVGEKDRLIPAQINPDGTIALARISEGMGWTLTNSLDF